MDAVAQHSPPQAAVLVDGPARRVTCHRKNLLDPRAKSVGIGMAIGANGKLYAVQNFGR